MELQSVTAKVDALRDKGFSDAEINQLLDHTSQSEGAAPVSEASVLAALKQGNTQILQQFSKGKDPEVFNAKVDEIVEFMEKDSKSSMKVTGSSFIICMSIFIFALNTKVLSFDTATNIASITLGSCFVVNIAFAVYTMKRRYAFLKPRLLYFIRK